MLLLAYFFEISNGVWLNGFNVEFVGLESPFTLIKSLLALIVDLDLCDPKFIPETNSAFL